MKFESLIHDVRFGVRVLFRRPAFTILIVVVLALGIGANTAIFTIVDAVLLRPLPYHDSDRMVLVWQSSKEHRATGEWFNTYREFQEWQRSSRSFEKLAALTWAVSEKTLAWRGKTESVLAIPASVDFFSMLGVNAAVGRTFERSDLNGALPSRIALRRKPRKSRHPGGRVGHSDLRSHASQLSPSTPSHNHRSAQCTEE